MTRDLRIHNAEQRDKTAEDRLPAGGVRDALAQDRDRVVDTLATTPLDAETIA